MPLPSLVTLQLQLPPVLPYMYPPPCCRKILWHVPGAVGGQVNLLWRGPGQVHRTWSSALPEEGGHFHFYSVLHRPCFCFPHWRGCPGGGLFQCQAQVIPGTEEAQGVHCMGSLSGPASACTAAPEGDLLLQNGPPICLQSNDPRMAGLPPSKKWKCAYCSTQTSSRLDCVGQTLASHSQIRTPSLCSCRVCTFNSAKALWDHLTLMHNIDTRRLKNEDSPKALAEV